MNTLSLVLPMRCARKLSAANTNHFYRDAKLLALEFNYYIALAASDKHYSVELEVPFSTDKDALMFVCACFEEDGYEVTVKIGSESRLVTICWEKEEQYD